MIHWQKVTDGERGTDVIEFLRKIKALPKNQLWRHNQAGDLLHVDGNIDMEFLTALIKANRGKNGFTYTHHVLSEWNKKAIKQANREGFTINASADNVKQAIQNYREGIPTVTLLPKDAPKKQMIDDVKVVRCPAYNSDKINCSNCKLCADSERQYIIGFPAHGTASKTVDIIAKG